MSDEGATRNFTRSILDDQPSHNDRLNDFRPEIIARADAPQA